MRWTRREVIAGAGALAVGCKTVQPKITAPTRWAWTGGVTPNAATIVARREDQPKPPLTLFAEAHPSETRTVEPVETAPATFRYAIDRLEPDTAYGYAIAGDLTGRFRTFPREGPASFSFCAGSCSETASEHPVFRTIAKHDPHVFLHLGDMHYENIAENAPDRFRTAFDMVLSSSAQSSLYRRVPVAYVWDDHDYGANNSDQSSPSRPAAHASYRAHVPSYRLASTGPIHHAFTLGRVRFLMTDSRSERTKVNIPHRYRTMLGAQQKAWLKNELLEAKGRYPLIVWVSPVGWIGNDDRSDSWPGFLSERTELAYFLVEHGIGNVLMLSGDAHMLAIDDGRHNDYANRGPQFPIFHVGALDQFGSEKGGPYSHGVEPGGGHFALVTVEDRVHTMNVTLSGRNAEDREVMAYRFSVPG